LEITTMTRTTALLALAFSTLPAHIGLAQLPSREAAEAPQLAPIDELAPIETSPISEAAPSGETATTAEPAPYPNASPQTPAMDAEREKVWNSPAMLRARAWLQDYCARSAKVTPEEARQYMEELQRLTPVQMKLWLLKFQEHEEMIEQQQAAFNMQRQAGLRQAAAVNRATQQAYADINAGETAKAETAQQSLNEQAQFAQQMSAQLSENRDYRATLNSLPWGMAWANQSPWGPYAGYPMGGPGPYGPLGGGDAHYHVHYHAAPATAPPTPR
jgi:hypothetical protein